MMDLFNAAADIKEAKAALAEIKTTVAKLASDMNEIRVMLARLEGMNRAA